MSYTVQILGDGGHAMSCHHAHGHYEKLADAVLGLASALDETNTDNEGV